MAVVLTAGRDSKWHAGAPAVGGNQLLASTLSTTSTLTAAVTGGAQGTTFLAATLSTTSELSAAITGRSPNQALAATLSTTSALSADLRNTTGASSVKIIAVGDLAAAGGAGTVKAQIAAYYADSACAALHTIGDNVYEGSQPSQWTDATPVAYDGEVTRGAVNPAHQWVFPGTGHHDWGDSGTAGAAEAGATVHSPADGLKPYFDGVVAGLAYGSGLWYYATDLAGASWRVIHLSGTIHAPGAAGPVGTDGNPLVPVGGGDVTNKALTANVATLTLNTGHGILATDTVTVALNPADPVFDGTHPVLSVTATTVTFSKTHANVPSGATGGQVGTAQYTWFAAQLDDCAANAITPLVLWSDPYFATTDNHHSSEQTMLPFWYLLTKKVPGNALVLNSHKHNYERTDQMKADGSVDATNGIVQIVVGTGGTGLYSFTGSPASWSLFRDDTHFGVLELVLSAGQAVYTWKNANGGAALDGPTTITMGAGSGGGGGGGAILYGTTAPGIPVLTPSTRRNMVHAYNASQLTACLSLPNTTSIIYTATSLMQQGSNRADLRGDNGAIAKATIVNTLVNYWSALPDRADMYANPYHEPDNGDHNPDGTLITGAQISAELDACIASVKPRVNSGRSNPVTFGSIFTGGFFVNRTAAAQDAWISPNSDWLGADLYQDTRTIAAAAAAATRQSIPVWIHPEVGTSVAVNPPDNAASEPAHKLHMQTLQAIWAGMSFKPRGCVWFDANHNLLDANLSGAVAAGATSLPVNGIPGKSGATYSMANGAAVRVIDGALSETVTLTSGVSQGSAGSATLPVTALAHAHASGKVVHLMPLSVAYWNGLS